MSDEVPVLTIRQKTIACVPRIESTDFEFSEEPKEPFTRFTLKVSIMAGITDNDTAKILTLAKFILPHSSNADCCPAFTPM